MKFRLSAGQAKRHTEYAGYNELLFRQCADLGCV